MAGRMRVLQGDITTLEVDAIVNAANEGLMGGGGVDGAIHRAAGPGLVQETRRLGGCKTGDAKTTRGHDLPARFVIHTVGPVWHGGRQDEVRHLRSAYQRSLEEARDHDCRTVAFPAISTGAYGFPPDLAAKTAVETVRGFLEAHDLPEEVLFCTFSAADTALYQGLLERVA